MREEKGLPPRIKSLTLLIHLASRLCHHRGQLEDAEKAEEPSVVHRWWPWLTGSWSILCLSPCTVARLLSISHRQEAHFLGLYRRRSHRVSFLQLNWSFNYVVQLYRRIIKGFTLDHIHETNAKIIERYENTGKLGQVLFSIPLLDFKTSSLVI